MFEIMGEPVRVAIDGPAGAGKSTVAKLLAERLGFLYLDTGALYRTATVGCIEQQVDKNDPEAVAAVVSEMEIELLEGIPYLNGRNVSKEIRKPNLTEQVTKIVASNSKVRELMTKAAREAAENCDIVADGRDVAKRIFPNAQIKIYLDASEEERARRRHKELIEKGENVNYSSVLSAIQARDNDDFNRSYDHLERLPEAINFDTTGLTIKQVVDELEKLVKKEVAKRSE